MQRPDFPAFMEERMNRNHQSLELDKVLELVGGRKPPVPTRAVMARS